MRSTDTGRGRGAGFFRLPALLLAAVLTAACLSCCAGTGSGGDDTSAVSGPETSEAAAPESDLVIAENGSISVNVVRGFSATDAEISAAKTVREYLLGFFPGGDVRISDDIIMALAAFANGDARTALSTLEMMILNADRETGADGREVIKVTEEDFEQCTSRKSLLYDKQGEEHYNLISALHKSMRNSDADAAVYWLARMLESGEDPMYIARRVTRFAAEDIGLADPRALELSVAAFQACHLIGMPECSVHLTEAVIYNSLAPKSNAVDVAYMEAAADANKTIAEPVPLQIRNAPTKLMKELDYGKGYIYAHDTEDKIADMQCLPDNLKGREYYHPGDQGFEPRFRDRYEAIKKWREEQSKK